VLFVSPPINFPTLHELRDHLKNDPQGAELLARLEREIPIKEKSARHPESVVHPNRRWREFFDGFGFAPIERNSDGRMKSPG